MSDTSLTIGNYHTIATIATGSFGRVYLARHSVLTTRVVALKLMHTIPFLSARERAQFLEEAQILEQLQHPYILPILDVGLHEDIPYIVSAYAAGGSLRQRLNNQQRPPLSYSESLTILAQIGQALQYAHDQHIIHRDIKPENILFHENGQALLADFGLATTLGTASVKEVSQSGTPRYMAPEQFQGQVSKESDQYSLSCVAYELFAGNAPFQAMGTIALMYQHVNTPPVPPRQHNIDIPPHIDEAVLKALQKHRSQRHHNVAAFIAALQAQLPLELTSSDPSSASSPPSETILTTPANSPDSADATGDDNKTIVKFREDKMVSTEPPANDGAVTKEPAIFPSNDQVSDLTFDTQPPRNNITLLTPTPDLHNRAKNRSLVMSKRQLTWLLAAVACLTFLSTIFGSLFLNLPVSALMFGSNPKLSRSPSAVILLSPTATRHPQQMPSRTVTAKPQLTPGLSPTAVLPAIPASQPTTVPVSTPTPTAKPRVSVSYYACGSQATLTGGPWNTVQPGTTVNNANYSGPVNSYTGGSGINAASSYCSGLYHWAWNQYSSQATWVWSNAYLPSGRCSVVVHIPSWYAGASAAIYTLYISSSNGNVSYSFDPTDQNQIATTWLSLLINGQIPSIALPKGSSDTYTLTLSLQNGGASNLYLGADAIKFVCSSIS